MDNKETFIDLLFNKTPPEYKIYYAFIMLVCIYFLTKMNIRFDQTVAIITGIIIIYIYSTEHRKSVNIENDDLEYKLVHIDPYPKYFHHDADIVDFFYSIKDFEQYNEPSFKSLINTVDNFLMIQNDINTGVYHCKENIDVAKDLMKKALQLVHSYVYSLPVNHVYNKKVNDSQNRLHMILRRHLDKMIKKCNNDYKERGINTDSKFIYNKGPKGSNEIDKYEYY